MKTSSPGKGTGIFATMIDRIADAAGYSSMFAVIVAMLIIVYEVIGRYFLKMPAVWEVEAAVMLTIYVTFVGSAFTLKNNAHIRMDDIVLPHLKQKPRKWLSVITSILSFCFCVILSFKSWQMFWEALRSGWRSETIWGPPLAIPYSFLSVGVSIMCLQYVVVIAASIRSLRQGVDNG